MTARCTIGATLVLAGLLTLGAGAQEKLAAGWPCWRGPGQDGQVAELPAKLPAAPKAVWQKPLAGEGHAPLAVGGGLVIVADHEKETQDIYRAFDAQTGEEKWTYKVPNTVEMEYSACPRAMPLITGERVYVVGAVGDLHCLDLKTGKAVWKKDLHKLYAGGGDVATWGYCSSPLLVDGKVVVSADSGKATLVALKPDTGDVVWQAKGRGMNYSSFIVAEFGGKKQIVGYDSSSLGGWDPATGERLWSLPVESSGGYIVPTAAVVNGKILLSTKDEKARLYDVKEGKIVATPLATNEDVDSEMTTATAAGDLVLAMGEGLIAVDPKDGLKTLWKDEEDKSKLSGLVFFFGAKDKALAFGEDGSMVLVAAEKGECKVLGRAKIRGKSWSCPAVADGKVYSRDSKNVYCHELK